MKPTVAPEVGRFARRVTYRIQTQDVRKYLLSDVVRRARGALVRAGGTYVRTLAPPKRIKRWCVLRSPHVNKTSREHFWMHTHTRILQCDIPADDAEALAASHVIARNLPHVAVRIEHNSPGLCMLGTLWDLSGGGDAPAKAEGEGEGESESADETLQAGEKAIDNKLQQANGA